MKYQRVVRRTSLIESVIGKIEIDPTVLAKPSQNLIPKAPGMKYTHYSPKADVILIQGNDLQKVQEKIQELARNSTKKIGILATDQTYHIVSSFLHIYFFPQFS